MLYFDWLHCSVIQAILCLCFFVFFGFVLFCFFFVLLFFVLLFFVLLLGAGAELIVWVISL